MRNKETLQMRIQIVHVCQMCISYFNKSSDNSINNTARKDKSSCLFPYVRI